MISNEMLILMGHDEVAAVPQVTRKLKSVHETIVAFDINMGFRGKKEIPVFLKKQSLSDPAYLCHV